MLKQKHRYVNYFHRALEGAISFGVWLGVFNLRFYQMEGAQAGLDGLFLRAGFLIALLTAYFFSREGLYKSQRFGSLWGEYFQVIKANSLAVISLVVLLYFVSEARLSRGVILAYYLISTVSFMMLRSLVRSALRYLRTQGKNLRHIILMGSGPSIEAYISQIHTIREYGVKISGWIDSAGLAKKYGVREISYEPGQLQGPKKPDGIILGYHGKDVAKVEDILRDLHNDLLSIVVLPDMSYALVGYQIENLAGVPALFVNQPSFSSTDILTKRLFDLTISGLGLLILTPVLLLLSILVRLSSPGPIFYGQERVGLDGQKFKMWKFRSMKVNIGSSGVTPGWTVANDPRRTRIGTFLRSTSLDELPQLWNVFIGQMSLIGPRPEQPYFVDKFRNEIPAYMLRHKMKAGITGWAQVHGWRGDTCLHKRIECDLYYIRNWSLWLDIKILFMTLWTGFINKNAY